MGLQNKKGGSEKPPRLVQNIRSNISTQLPQHQESKLRNEMWMSTFCPIKNSWKSSTEEGLWLRHLRFSGTLYRSMIQKRPIWAVAVNLFFNRKTMDCMFTRFLAILIALPQTVIIILYDGTHFWVMKLFAVIMIVKRAFWILLWHVLFLCIF